ncbi:VG15 protein [Mycobacteroides immunogenum]|uniref:MuF-like minor capsid protein n=1 Tax=Mycobacteroides immunogenum TaxID=83262 RepID=A0A7V8LR70_9MYCO|nr:hypothetical protein [Mycobacteroides immunogenum]KPG13736.1 hypothetical protein AN909_05655 [Mycobacteroides immunogenum]KPG14274.1 hypothetical protein AN908_06745 [Mycobacteroides immunogenum]KPG14350.1 hypothetical protein AN908_07255 [Mycobacteroides immunogenum]KPG17450.1 hypothetical protein AN910_04880 [Mycobacteroides immunogenum]KPG23966.1 hypothetical protein AN911_00275 [Mycobacteroides immunogenum]
MTQPSNQDRLTPIPELAAWYAVQHQREQESIAAKVAAGMLLLWPNLVFDRLTETTESWLHGAMLQVQRGWDESAAAAGEFVQASLWSVEPDGPPIPDLKVEFPARDVATALTVTGPVNVKKQMPAPQADVMAKAQKASSGAAQTRALDGGREMVQAQVLRLGPERKSRRKAVGYARFTDSNPCYFCAMLASRGAFYLSKDSFKASNKRFEGDGTAKVHDHCKCSLRPVFSLADGLDDRAKYFYNMWVDAQNTRKSGETAIQAYRRFYVPPPPYKLGEVLSLDERRNAIEVSRRNRDILLLNRGLREDSPQIVFWERTMALLEQG